MIYRASDGAKFDSQKELDDYNDFLQHACPKCKGSGFIHSHIPLTFKVRVELCPKCNEKAIPEDFVILSFRLTESIDKNK